LSRSTAESMALCRPSRLEIAPARSLVIAAGGGRDLVWPHQRVAAELLARSGGRMVHLLLHGGTGGPLGPFAIASCWSRPLPGRWLSPPPAVRSRCWCWRSPVVPARHRSCSRRAAWPPAPPCRFRLHRSVHRQGSGLLQPSPAAEPSAQAFRAIGAAFRSHVLHSSRRHACSHSHSRSPS
jgi:hypothetical protein